MQRTARNLCTTMHAACNMQQHRETCNMQRTQCNAKRATGSMQRSIQPATGSACNTGNMQPTALQPATRATCPAHGMHNRQLATDVQRAERTTSQTATCRMQHENVHPATCCNTRPHAADSVNLQARRHATDTHMQIDKMQQEFTVCNRPDATCSMEHATHTHVQEGRCNMQNRQDATGRAAACNMQKTGCNVATWNFGLQHATCEAHNGGCSGRHAAGANG